LFLSLVGQASLGNHTAVSDPSPATKALQYRDYCHGINVCENGGLTISAPDRCQRHDNWYNCQSDTLAL
jgi:hypothetical protein